MSNAKVLQSQDIQSYGNLGPMVIDDLSVDISRGEQQYCNSLQQHNIGGDLIDYELVGCYLQETNEQALRIPGVGIIAFGPSGTPADILNSLDYGIFAGHIAEVRGGDGIPYYIFSDGTIGPYKFRLKNA